MTAPDGGEIPLSGNALTRRGVVRVGDTVRRPWGARTASAHDMLRHLDTAGFAAAPRPLGRDGRAREVLAYLPGEDCGWPLRDFVLRDEGARRLGRLARDLRAALSSYRCPRDAVWQVGSGPPAAGQLLQHGDLGPWNILWDGDTGPTTDPTGVIDWDLAHPAEPWYDTAFLAWFTVPFMADERAAARGFPTPPARRARLAAFSAGCGMVPQELVAAVTRVQAINAERIATFGAEGLAPWTEYRDRGLARDAERDRAWTVRTFPE